MSEEEKVAKGYYIRRKKDGEIFGELSHAWSIDGELPEEWRLVPNDPTVASAHIFSATQRRRWAQNRIILESYERPAEPQPE